MFKSATFKLTLWYLAIVMVISISFSAAVYHLGTNEVSYGLQQQTQRIYDRYPVFGQDPFFRPRDRDLDSAARHLLARLVYFNILVLAGAGAASYFLARRTLQPIEAAHDRQKRFTADVSHELRTPLTSLKMSSEVAMLDPKANKAELKEALQSNLEDATVMENLINNLLRLSTLDDGTTVKETVAAQVLLDDAVQQVAKTAEIKQVTVNAKPVEFSVQADRDSLIQLLVILLDNAVKYSPRDSTVKLEAAHQKNQAVFIITDQGSGISKEDLPHVFDRFYRADSARTKTDASGYGLGLSIAKMIADRHNGSITLSSQPGKGTTATVTLPQEQ